MWKGRFQEDPSERLRDYGESVSYDWQLYREDIRGSVAHARALQVAGILTEEEFGLIEKGLLEIRAEIEAGTFPFSADLEDVHMNIEAELTRRIGPAGAKLHTARSRNDQVSLDMRLWMRRAVSDTLLAVRELQRSLVEWARRQPEAVLPGYTHLQRAQPVLLAHHLLAYVEMLQRDASRLEDCARRGDVMPLGSGALAGSTIILDREAIASELNFGSVSRNSMDAISDRDFAMEALATLSIIGVHLSRLSEDLILWCSAEFGFVELGDRHTTGSSLMPQKKNPDIAELTRGKSGRLIGNLVSLLTTMKGLPLTYNRDMQEDKEPLFDSFATVQSGLCIFAEMIADAKFHEAVAIEASSDPNLLATDLADQLVLAGVPFRQAHKVVGTLVAKARELNIPLNRVPESDRLAISPLLVDRMMEETFDVQTGLRARKGIGAPSPENVAAELERWLLLLKD